MSRAAGPLDLHLQGTHPKSHGFDFQSDGAALTWALNSGGHGFEGATATAIIRTEMTEPDNEPRFGKDVTRDLPPRSDIETRRWGVILAGGDGIRLRKLTRFICGDDRPKQFCPLLGDSSLVQETRRRAERSIDPHQILYSVTRIHQDHYVRDLADRTSQTIVQPGNKGTAPAILSALLCISQMDRDALVAILPCDHYYSRETEFTSAFDSAFAIAGERTASVVLLGAQPKAAEVEYGWIELGEGLISPYVSPHVSPSRTAFQVKSFQEKPPPLRANMSETLLDR